MGDIPQHNAALRECTVRAPCGRRRLTAGPSFGAPTPNGGLDLAVVVAVAVAVAVAFAFH